ncbi:MAG TPA: molybdate ABC transporter permease subunit, partial [Methanocorpusculum sp.]|nr:molybdate ABC transporter permease subunit [Methanocorpusculum sp.]
MSSTDTRRHSATRIGTMVVAGGLILLFLVFITIPLLSLFTRVSVEDFITALTSPLAMDALWLSAVTATFSTVVVVVLGTPLAYVNARFPYRGRNVVDTLTDLPIVLPPTVA